MEFHNMTKSEYYGYHQDRLAKWQHFGNGAWSGLSSQLFNLKHSHILNGGTITSEKALTEYHEGCKYRDEIRPSWRRLFNPNTIGD